jgi:hypothetical protein
MLIREMFCTVKKYFKAEDESIRGEVRLIGNLLNIVTYDS